MTPQWLVTATTNGRGLTIKVDAIVAIAPDYTNDEHTTVWTVMDSAEQVQPWTIGERYEIVLEMLQITEAM